MSKTKAHAKNSSSLRFSKYQTPATTTGTTAYYPSSAPLTIDRVSKSIKPPNPREILSENHSPCACTPWEGRSQKRDSLSPDSGHGCHCPLPCLTPRRSSCRLSRLQAHLHPGGRGDASPGTGRVGNVDDECLGRAAAGAAATRRRAPAGEVKQGPVAGAAPFSFPRGAGSPSSAGLCFLGWGSPVGSSQQHSERATEAGWGRAKEGKKQQNARDSLGSSSAGVLQPRTNIVLLLCYFPSCRWDLKTSRDCRSNC